MVSKSTQSTEVETSSVESSPRAEKTEKASKSTGNWVSLKPAEIEKIIVDLGKKGHSSAYIGLVLRDSHGVGDVRTATGKRINQILKAHSIESPTQLALFKTRTERLKAHQTRHTHDYTATKALHKHSWVVHKLEKQ